MFASGLTPEDWEPREFRSKEFDGISLKSNAVVGFMIETKQDKRWREVAKIELVQQQGETANSFPRRQNIRW